MTQNNKTSDYQYDTLRGQIKKLKVVDTDDPEYPYAIEANINGKQITIYTNESEFKEYVGSERGKQISKELAKYADELVSLEIRLEKNLVKRESFAGAASDELFGDIENRIDRCIEKSEDVKVYIEELEEEIAPYEEYTDKAIDMIIEAYMEEYPS